MSTQITKLSPTSDVASGRGARGPRWRRLLPLVATLALGVVALGAGSAIAGEPPVPFEAAVAGTLTPTTPTTFSLAGTGLASHLGAIGDYHADVTVTSGTVGGTDVTDTLTETLTAANGDTLVLLCRQSATLLGGGRYEGTDTWTVIGGTGRFSNATGSGTGTTHVDLGSGTFTKDMTGTIAY